MMNISSSVKNVLSDPETHRVINEVEVFTPKDGADWTFILGASLVMTLIVFLFLADPTREVRKTALMASVSSVFVVGFLYIVDSAFTNVDNATGPEIFTEKVQKITGLNDGRIKELVKDLDEKNDGTKISITNDDTVFVFEYNKDRSKLLVTEDRSGWGEKTVVEPPATEPTL